MTFDFCIPIILKIAQILIFARSLIAIRIPVRALISLLTACLTKSPESPSRS